MNSLSSLIPTEPNPKYNTAQSELKHASIASLLLPVRLPVIIITRWRHSANRALCFMEIYLVGGAVRDELLGIPVKDRDWVVVGATPDDMLTRGYRQVGADFPVFLHPQTREEYALARTERKQGHGYHGFTVYSAPDVTLEDDLKRRDLTINAVAQAEDGSLVDPFGGRNDLENRKLRHVSDAFSEDPLRILRTARFAARFITWVSRWPMKPWPDAANGCRRGGTAPGTRACLAGNPAGSA